MLPQVNDTLFQTPHPGIRMTAHKRKEAQHELLLDGLADSWPDHHRFPHNFRGDQVRDVVWQDLLAAEAHCTSLERDPLTPAALDRTRYDI